MAHECAHIALHAVLHPVNPGPALFDDLTGQTTAVMCHGKAIEAGATANEWWEIQANRGMASLLLARDLLQRYLGECLGGRRFVDLRAALAADAGDAIIRELLDTFDVGYSMTRYRLQDVGFISPRRTSTSNASSLFAFARRRSSPVRMPSRDHPSRRAANSSTPQPKRKSSTWVWIPSFGQQLL